MNHLLQEKDDQITQLRNYVESQEGSYEEKGASSAIRISELEQQLQQRSNEYYRLQDEKIKIEQELRLDIQRLEDEYNNLVDIMFWVIVNIVIGEPKYVKSTIY